MDVKYPGHPGQYAVAREAWLFPGPTKSACTGGGEEKEREREKEKERKREKEAGAAKARTV